MYYIDKHPITCYTFSQRLDTPQRAQIVPQWPPFLKNQCYGDVGSFFVPTLKNYKFVSSPKATTHLLKSKKARSYKANGKTYVLDLEKNSIGLVVKTWGFDYEGFVIPRTRAELIGTKNRIQLRKMDGPLDGVDQVALRYYLDILRRNG